MIRLSDSVVVRLLLKYLFFISIVLNVTPCKVYSTAHHDCPLLQVVVPAGQSPGEA